MPLMNPDVDLGLTLSGCAMFQVLTSKLHQMQKIIAPEIFRKCWKNIADQLCKVSSLCLIVSISFSPVRNDLIKFVNYWDSILKIKVDLISPMT